MKRIFFLCAFPPPMGGAAKNSLLISEHLQAKGKKVVKINTSIGKLSHNRSPLYHIDRVRRFLTNLTTLLFSLRSSDTCYIVPDGGLGLFYTFAYAIVCRLRKCDAILHYRNYSYIEKRSTLLRAIINQLSPRLLEVFLDEHMQKRFSRIYGTNNQMVVLNTAFLENILSSDTTEQNNIADRPLRIAHLSNLCSDKGLYRVIEIIDATRDLPLVFEIAGSPVTASDKRAIAECIKRNPGRINARGPLTGESKHRFYKSCDAFLFPTIFSQEAQPNVIWEAMQCGLIIISHDRGSIRWMIEPLVKEGNGLIMSEKDYVTDFRGYIVELINNQERLKAAKEATMDVIRNATRDGNLQYKELLMRLCGPEVCHSHSHSSSLTQER